MHCESKTKEGIETPRDTARREASLAREGTAALAARSWARGGGHRTLAEKAFEVLHEAILTGELQPGERLLIEDLAQALDMSPMPIREALRRLDSAGLVEHVPHRGARVTELSVADLREIYTARLALEPLAIRIAAEGFTEEDASRARESLARHIDAYRRGDLREAWSTHTAFHFALYSAAGSRWLLRLITPLWESSERYRLAIRPIERSLEERRAEHERILNACIEQASDLVAHELHDHLARTANLIARQMGEEPLFELLGNGARPRSR